MRTTLTRQVQNALDYTNAASQKLMDAQNHASTGKRILKPSDDVPGTNRALTLQSSINSVDQYTDNVTVSKPLVDTTESALNDMVQIINNIKTLAIRAANADWSGGVATDAYLTDLDGYLSQLTDIANTRVSDQYIFSGTSTSTPPVRANAGPVPDPAVQPYIYAGNNGVRTAQVLNWISLPVNMPGDKVFNFDTGAGNPGGVGTTDVFTMVRNLRDAISAKNPTQISAQLDNIGKNFDNVLTCQAQVGSWQNRMESAQTTLSITHDRLTQMLSDTEDIDLAQAVVDLKTQENVYQAALAVTARMMSLSLASMTLSQ